jgi:hypothetical protein
VDYLAIKLYAANGGTAGDVLEFMINGRGIEYWQNAYSAAAPLVDSASNGMIAVGAIEPVNGTTIAGYSSWGPTNDGRIKPDLSAPSCFASFSYSPDCFRGTSAATPAVAGAAALVIGAGIATTPAQLKSYLLNNATVDRGAAGPDTVYGQGELILPAPSKLNQTITVTTGAPASAVYGTSFTVAATAPGGAVVYSSAGACTNSGAVFTLTSGTGTCTVKYDQPGNSTYNAAQPVTQSATATKASQAITITTHAPPTAVYRASFSVAVTGGRSGNPVTFSSSGACTNSGVAFTITSGTGTCAVAYDQAGDANYSAAHAAESVAAQKAGQTIAFGPLPARTYGARDFTVSATASSGLPVAFSAAGSCTVSGATVHVTTAGSCTVTASQAGDANFSAAANVPRAFTIAKPIRCVVPRVVGKRLAAARVAIRVRHCSTGRVAYATSLRAKRGKVVAQSRRPGRVLPVNTRINLVVGRGRGR